MARSPKAAAQAVPLTPNRERPSQPERYQASKEELLSFYHQMLLIRRFEERAGQLAVSVDFVGARPYQWRKRQGGVQGRSVQVSHGWKRGRHCASVPNPWLSVNP